MTDHNAESGAPVEVASVLPGDHLIGLECGHFWAGDGVTDDGARTFLAALRATGDTAWCPRCGSQRRVTGPLAKVLNDVPQSDG